MTTAAPTRSGPGSIRLGRIGFINVDPIYFGLEHRRLSNDIEIHAAPPAELNRMLGEGLLDISSVSSAAYGLHHRDWILLPGVSVACSGNVMSVLLVSRQPLDRLHGKKVLVTEDSATAVRLMRLMFFHKGVSPVLETRKIHTPDQVDAGAEAALVIGDAALRHDWNRRFEHVWDLGDLWARYANLPFVFALWAVRKEFADQNPHLVSKTVELLRESKRMGLDDLDTVVKTASSRLRIDPSTTRQYFNNFCFDLGTSQQDGLRAFFDDLHGAGIFTEKIPVRFFKTGPSPSS